MCCAVLHSVSKVDPRGRPTRPRSARRGWAPASAARRALSPAALGCDGGPPADRHYLHRFLDGHRDAIRGDVLEIQNESHTRRYGSHLGDVHTVDILPELRPTYHCDLAASEGV